MEASKIALSPAELALAQDAQIILTKNSVIQKTVALLANVQDELVERGLSFASPSPKISKGENYRGLPYVVLDYPRISTGEDLLFVRSLFWWGHFFSSTLQLAGIHKQHQQKLLDGYDVLLENDYFIGINPDPWQHHFGQDNFKPINELSKDAFAVVLEETPHIKIAARFPLTEWNTAAKHLVKSWELLMALLETT